MGEALMTDNEIERIAKLMGARIIAKLPGPLHGAAGAAYATGFYNARMQQLREQECQEAKRSSPVTALDVSVSAPARKVLDQISKQIDVSAEQVAAAVLEEILPKMPHSFANRDQFVAALSTMARNGRVLEAINP